MIDRGASKNPYQSVGKLIGLSGKRSIRSTTSAKFQFLQKGRVQNQEASTPTNSMFKFIFLKKSFLNRSLCRKIADLILLATVTLLHTTTTTLMLLITTTQ